jgi:tetratricopeptide (TPR) repeat protein
MVVIVTPVIVAACTATKKVPPAVVADKDVVDKRNMPKGRFKVGGDFADGEAVTAVLGDMSVKTTISQLLAKHSSEINLSHVAEYAEKASRDDLMIFQQRDAGFVSNLNLSSMGLSDDDLDGVSKLKLQKLNVAGNKLKNLHAIKNMKSLNFLGLADNPLESEAYNVIGSLDKVITLDLRETPVNDNQLAALMPLKNLKLLYLSNCQFLGDGAVQQFRKKHPLCAIITREDKKEYRVGYADLMRINSSLIKDGEYAEADMSLQSLISRWKSLKPVPYPIIARAYRLRAQCQIKMERDDIARRMYQESIGNFKRSAGNDNELPFVRIDFALLLEKLGQIKGALEQRSQADAYWQKNKPDPASLSAFMSNQQWLIKHH